MDEEITGALRGHHQDQGHYAVPTNQRHYTVPHPGIATTRQVRTIKINSAIINSEIINSMIIVIN